MRMGTKPGVTGPLETYCEENSMGSTGISVLYLLILIADVYAVVMILQSSARSNEKLLWVLLVLILPLIGVIVWYLAGPGKKPF